MARILIMEDDVDQARAWANVLRVQSHDVTLTTGAEEAKLQVTQNAFDLAIVDMYVKRGNTYISDGGLRLISFLRAPRSPSQQSQARLDIPILAVSGGARINGGHDPLRLARDQGADMWLRKPIDRDGLLDAVARLLEDDIT